MLTIKSFSRITAIPETTLRYYDQQGVLSPRGRGENGYRFYHADQILPAKFLYSLRLASIPTNEVKAYHQATGEARQEALTRWHAELGERLNWLTLARKYIEGLMQGHTSEITLQTMEPERIIWFTHDGQIGEFGEHYIRRIDELQAAGIGFTDTYFRWMADLEPGWIRGGVGFRLAGPKLLPLPPDAELEERRPTLLLSLEHKAPMAEIRSTYRRLYAFMREHGWEAAGDAMERYPVGSPEDYCEVLIPILFLER